MFSETEMIVVYAGLAKLESFDENTYEETKMYEEIKSKISNLISDIEEKIYEQKPQFLENEKYVAVSSEYNEQELVVQEDNQEDYEQQI